jgi:drug/metabolite transporter (DMT)-like permease
LLANWLVGEPITLNLVLGLGAVFAGIWIATTEATPQGAGNITTPR